LHGVLVTNSIYPHCGKTIQGIVYEKLKTFRLFGLQLPRRFTGWMFQPHYRDPPKTGDLVTDPFTIDIMIGKDDSALTLAGRIPPG
jgi:hypothetical protein